MKINKGYLTARTDTNSDEWLTPAYAVEPIVDYLKQREYHTIWCPFDKADSQFVRVLRDNDFKVQATHIENGTDFFESDIPRGTQCIVSNPPFSKKVDILKQCYKLNIPFALLLPQNTLQSKKTTELFIEHGVEYLGFDKRICFYNPDKLEKPQSGVAFATGYFCSKVLPERLKLQELQIRTEPYY